MGEHRDNSSGEWFDRIFIGTWIVLVVALIVLVWVAV